MFVQRVTGAAPSAVSRSTGSSDLRGEDDSQMAKCLSPYDGSGMRVANTARKERLINLGRQLRGTTRFAASDNIPLLIGWGLCTLRLISLDHRAACHKPDFSIPSSFE